MCECVCFPMKQLYLAELYLAIAANFNLSIGEKRGEVLRQ